MEDTYEKFIQDAQNSVVSDYAKDILKNYREYDGDTGGLIRSVADIFRGSFLNMELAMEWIRPALCLLLLFWLFHMVQNLLKSRTAISAVQYFLNMAMAVTVAAPVYELLSRACSYMNDMTLFFGVLTPVMGVMTASGGNVAAAGANSVFLTIFLSVAQFLIDRLVPAMCAVFIGLAMISVVSGDAGTLQFSKWFRNTLFGALSVCVTLLFIVIGCQNLTVTSMDTFTAKTLRLLVSNAVPVVGGTIGDAIRFAGGGLVTVKNATGMASVVFLLAVFLPVLFMLWITGLILSVLISVCDYFSMTLPRTFLGNLKCAFDFSIAGFSAIFIMAIVNIGIFLGGVPALVLS